MFNGKTQRILDYGEKIWDVVSPYAPQELLDAIGVGVAKLLFGYSDIRLRRFVKETPFPDIPYAGLRYRVWGDPDISTFLKSGKRCSNDIKSSLTEIGENLGSFNRILDFGCGCGRVFMFLENTLKSLEFYGTDIDKEAIAWASRAHPFFKLSVNGHIPPLKYDSDFFDLILVIAVMSHFNEEDQFGWLQEFRRVLKYNGILIISLHGQYCWKDFPASEITTLESRGFLFKSLKDPYLRQIFPKWYQAAYHNKNYVMHNYAKYFHILKYIPRGLEEEADLIILQKA